MFVLSIKRGIVIGDNIVILIRNRSLFICSNDCGLKQAFFFLSLFQVLINLGLGSLSILNL